MGTFSYLYLRKKETENGNLPYCSFCRSALLIFSPPNQKENAQREKEDIEKKTKAR